MWKASSALQFGVSCTPRRSWPRLSRSHSARSEDRVDGVERRSQTPSTQVDDERKALEAEAEKINDAVADCDEDEQEALNQRLQALYERLDELDAATAEARASAILHGLGFTPKMQRMPTKSFSGGWRMRVALARALFLQPTCLVLDEPTNHLVLTQRLSLSMTRS